MRSDLCVLDQGTSLIYHTAYKHKPGCANVQCKAEQYATLLAHVGAAKAKAGLQNATLVGMTTAGIDASFIEAVAQRGGLRFLDGISVHPYRRDGPESVVSDWAKLSAMIDRYAPPERRPRLVSGEWGWATCASNTTGAVESCNGASGETLTQEEQASRLVRQRLVNDLSSVAISIWYDWQDDGNDRKTGEENFGSVHSYSNSSFPAGVPKTAFQAALVSSRLLRNCSLEGRINATSESVYLLGYHCPGVSRLVVWDTQAARNFSGDVHVSVTGRDAMIGCDGGHLFGGSLKGPIPGACEAACATDSRCHSFVTWPSGFCNTQTGACAHPSNESANRCGSSCAGAVAYSLARVNRTEVVPTRLAVPDGCYTVTDMLGAPKPAICTSQGALEMRLSSNPQYLTRQQ